MPFELVPYRPRGRPPVSIEDLDKVVGVIGNFKKKDIGGGKMQWIYKNPETGVYFLVLFDPGKKRQSYSDWNDSQLSIVVRLGKPSFFGYEAFPVIHQLLKNLNLGVLDPQKTAMFRHPTRLNDEQMRTSWEKNNMAEIKALLSSGKAVVTAPREKMDFFWRFMTIRKQMQDSLGPDVLVPPINLHYAKDGSVKMSCIWPDASKVVIPKVDYVFVTREEKKFLSKKKISGAVPFLDIVTILKSKGKTKREPVAHLLFDQSPDKDLVQRLSTLALEPPNLYPRLSPDEIIETDK